MNAEKPLKKIKEGLNFVGLSLKSHPAVYFFGLILMSFIGAFLIYYFYVLNTPGPKNEQPIEIKQDLYMETIEQLKNRQDNIQQGIRKNYPDIFK